MHRSAFTLLELMLVIALMVILAALSAPALDAMFAQRRMDAATDAVKAALATARAHAIDQGRSYRVAIMPGSSSYRVAPDSNAFWTGNDMPSEDDSNIPPIILSDTLPTGVIFVGAAGVGTADPSLAATPSEVSADQWQPVVVFLPDGTARDSVDSVRPQVEVTLEASQGRPVVVTVRCLTGTVSARRMNASGGP